MAGAFRIISGTGATLGLVLLLASSVRGVGPVEQASIVELRQYTLHPGQRDVLIGLFEQEFVESQESLGMRILGTFRDLDKPDRFVWLRGFPDMTARAPALKAFYEGPVWQAHRNAANATMVDSDNVLLLRVARPGSGVAPLERTRAPRGSSKVPPGLVVANIYYFDGEVPATFVDDFDKTARPALAAAAVSVNATYVSETSPNNFPRLPIRERDRVFIWLSVFPSVEDYERGLERLARSKEWQAASARIRERLKAEPEVLRLQPTPRSELQY
jgi:hypothetical protein